MEKVCEFSSYVFVKSSSFVLSNENILLMHDGIVCKWLEIDETTRFIKIEMKMRRRVIISDEIVNFINESLDILIKLNEDSVSKLIKEDGIFKKTKLISKTIKTNS